MNYLKILAAIVSISVAILGCSSNSVDTSQKAQKNPDAIYREGLVLLLLQQPGEAIASFQDACKMGLSAACERKKAISLLVKHKKTIEIPTVKCINERSCFDNVNLQTGRYDEACSAGNSDACFKLAMQHWSNRRKENAKKLFGQLCSKNHSGGCTGLGLTYEEAYKWDFARTSYRKACAKNYLPACEKLALLEHGHGVKKEAIPIARAACEKNHAPSCFTLAGLEASDGAIQKNIVSILKKACALDDVHACFKIYALEQSDASKKHAIQAWNQSCARNEHFTCGYFAWALNEEARIKREIASSSSSIWAAAFGGGALAGYQAGQKNRHLWNFAHRPMQPFYE